MRWGQTGNICSPPFSLLRSPPPSLPSSPLPQPPPPPPSPAAAEQPSSKTSGQHRPAISKRSSPPEHRSQTQYPPKNQASLEANAFLPPFVPALRGSHRPYQRLLLPRLLQLVVPLLLLLLLALLLPGAAAQTVLETGSARQTTDRAILEIVLYNPVENGGYITQSYKLVGMFSIAGAAISAEGRIIQLHPLGLCNTNDYDELYDYGWVGVVKLERPEFEHDPCLSVFGKAKRAMQRGATAVVFDITDNPVAMDDLQDSEDRLSRPIIIIQGSDAAKLVGIVNTQSEARIRIIYSPQELPAESVEISQKEYFGLGIFVAVFLVFSIICVFVTLKLRWRSTERQNSLSNIAKRAIAKLETRTYESPYARCDAHNHNHHHHHHHKSHLRQGSHDGSGHHLDRQLYDLRASNSDSSVRSSSISESCAICLEGYKEGQILRVMPCGHEFHRMCVDPWLENKGTCPLCKIHIAEQVDLQSEDGNRRENIAAVEATTTDSHADQEFHRGQQQRDQQQLWEQPMASRCSLYDPSVAGSRRSFFSLPYSTPGSQTGREREFTASRLVQASGSTVSHQAGQHPTQASRRFIQHTTCASCRSTLGSGRPSSNSNSSSFPEASSRAQPAVELPLTLPHFCLPSRQCKNHQQQQQQQQHHLHVEPGMREATDSTALSSYLAFQEPHRSVRHPRDSPYLYAQPTSSSLPSNCQNLNSDHIQLISHNMESCTCSFLNRPHYSQLQGLSSARAATVYTSHDARLYIPVQYPHAHQHSTPGAPRLNNLDIDLDLNFFRRGQGSDVVEEHETVRAASAKAIHGSCSSGSEECRGEGGGECSCHLSSTPSSLSANAASSSSCSSSSSFAAADACTAAANSSTRSMYGSSGHKDSSDVSSFDSNFYRGKGSSSSSDEKDAIAATSNNIRARETVVSEKRRNGYHSSGAHSDSGRGRSRARERDSFPKGLTRVHTPDWGSLSVVNAARAALLRPSCLPFSRTRTDFYDTHDLEDIPDRSRSRSREQERQALLGNQSNHSSRVLKSSTKDIVRKSDTLKRNSQEKHPMDVNCKTQGTEQISNSDRSETLKENRSELQAIHGSAPERLPVVKNSSNAYQGETCSSRQILLNEQKSTTQGIDRPVNTIKSIVPSFTNSHRGNLRLMLCRLNRRESSSSPCLSEASSGTCSWQSFSPSPAPSQTKRSSASSTCSSCGQVVLSSLATRLQHNVDDLQDFASGSDNGGNNHVVGGGEGLATFPPGTSLAFTMGTSDSGSAGYGRVVHYQTGRSRSASAKASRNQSPPSLSSSDSSSSSSSSPSSAFYPSKPKRTQSTPGRVTQSSCSQPSGLPRKDKLHRESINNGKISSKSVVGIKHDHTLTKAKEVLSQQLSQGRAVKIQEHNDHFDRQDNRRINVPPPTVLSSYSGWRAKAVTVHHSSVASNNQRGKSSRNVKPLERLSQKLDTASVHSSSSTSSTSRRRMLSKQLLQNQPSAPSHGQQNYQLIEQCKVCHKQQVVLSSQHSPLEPEVVPPPAALHSSRVCQMCHGSMPEGRSVQHAVTQPKHSMVLFTEAQGAFITIPLSEKDNFSRSNAV